MSVVHNAYLELIKHDKFYYDATQDDIAKLLDNFIVLLNQQAKHHKLKEKLFYLFKKKKSSQPMVFGIYLYGGVGRGKSMLMDLFYNTIVHPSKKRVHFHAFMRDIQKSLTYYRQNNEPDPLKKVAIHIAEQTKLLCFDELQVTDIADAMVLARLFTLLIEQGVRFVITSNRIPDDLYKNGINRENFLPFIALLKQDFWVQALDHPTDYRLARLQHEDIYICPLGRQTDIKMDNIWNILTDYHTGERKDLTISGRKVTISKTYKHIARLSFADICLHPLGTSDYLDIVKHYHIILFEKIPKMTAEMRNEAIRFRHFIDVLYEAKCRVYFSAEVISSLLYTGGDFAFEFERTVSRIEEMRSHEYIKNN